MGWPSWSGAQVGVVVLSMLAQAVPERVLCPDGQTRSFLTGLNEILTASRPGDHIILLNYQFYTSLANIYYVCPIFSNTTLVQFVSYSAVRKWDRQKLNFAWCELFQCGPDFPCKPRVQGDVRGRVLQGIGCPHRSQGSCSGRLCCRGGTRAQSSWQLLVLARLCDCYCS